MNNTMFCFQCEQTAGCKACTGVQGVCGKKADTALLQDKLTGALIGLARATEGNEDLVNEVTDKLILEGLFSTITNVNFQFSCLTHFQNKKAFNFLFFDFFFFGILCFSKHWHRNLRVFFVHFEQ